MTRRAAVAGKPIDHSLSPVLHKAAYAELGLDWDYDALECDELALPAMVTRLAAAPEFAGLSLTMPLKAVAFDVADHRADSALQVGVANTLVMTGGRTTAHNTDVTGLVLALAELDVRAPVSRPVILGGGGTARAALAALARLDATEVLVALRRPAAGQPLVELGRSLGLTVRPVAWPASYEELSGAGVVISTAPAGATDPLAAAGWSSGLPLLDVLYAPWPTPVATRVAAAGGTVVSGIEVLFWQATVQVELMTGRPAPIAAMHAALDAR